MEIWSAVIAGILALCGGYLGSRWQWRYQHREWLLRQRTEVFAQFLETLYGSLSEASKTFADNSLVEKEKRVQVIFNPMLDAAKKVRLLLAKEWRQPFENLTISISVKYIEATLDDGREPSMTNEIKQLEGIVERHVDDPETFANSISGSFFEKSLCLLRKAPEQLRKMLNKGKDPEKKSKCKSLH
jgi:hypothetical protein